MEGGAPAAVVAADDDGSHRVVKMRLKHLLSDQRMVERIQGAVERMHEIVARALVFGKLLFLADFATQQAANGGVFDAGVASRLATAFPIDAGQMEEWMDVVSSGLAGRVGRPYAPAKAENMRRLHAFYDDAAGRGLLPTAKLACTNLSSPKGHAAAQLAVNYRNNVHCHFDKYVRRWVRVSITAVVRAEHGVAPDAVAVPKPLRRGLAADIRAVCNDLLQSSNQLSCREALWSWVAQHRPTLMPSAPGGANQHWRFLSQKSHPERWLPYMVAIDRLLEGASAKLYSPLPQRTSFVPAHIRLDTIGLIDLLVADADDTLLLKAALEELDMPGSSSGTTKYDLPGLMPPLKKGEASQHASKAMLYVDLVKLVSPALQARVRQEPIRHGAAFKTAVWRCLTKLGAASNKHASLAFMELVFNNVIDTNGTSVSAHYVSPALHGVTRFNGGFKAIKVCQRSQTAAEKAKGATCWRDATVDCSAATLARVRWRWSPMAAARWSPTPPHSAASRAARRSMRESSAGCWTCASRLPGGPPASSCDRSERSQTSPTRRTLRPSHACKRPTSTTCAPGRRCRRSSPRFSGGLCSARRGTMPTSGVVRRWTDSPLASRRRSAPSAPSCTATGGARPT